MGDRKAALSKLNRIRRMTPAEAAYRLREKLRSERERIRLLLAPPRKPEPSLERSLTGSFLSYLRSAPSRRFYFSSGDRLQIFRMVGQQYPAWIERSALKADRVCSGTVELLGYGDIELGPSIDWHRDPVTGRRWPVRFWADYDPVRECGAGDAKVIHELNRHQHVLQLAKAFFLTGEEKYAREAVSLLESWIEQNPPSLGINWQSSLEIALRCVAWIWTLFFLLPSRALGEQSARSIGGSLFAQLDHVHRYPSVYSSPNTHLTGEATALFLAGTVFQEHGSAKRWRRKGTSLLLDQIGRQVREDGVHEELSTYYHCYTVDFYLQAFTLARQNGIEVLAAASEKLARMAEHLMFMLRPDGTVPAIGDDDGGRALPLAAGRYRSCRDLLCAAALLFGRPDFRQQAGPLAETAFWLFGEEGADLYRRLPGATPEERSRLFPNAGCLVVRSGWDRDSTHFTFDCGELGAPSGGHSHADALSFTLSVAGKDLLVDPGTFVYNGAPRWRDFFRSTRAHNTVTIDGRDQSECGGTFQWKSRFRVPAVRRFSHADIEYCEAEHDGYGRLPDPVVHRRRVLHTADYVCLLDDFRGRGRHNYEFNLHFAAGTDLSRQEMPATANQLRLQARHGEAGLELFLCASSLLTPAIVEGREEPPQGWVSTQYGRRDPAPVLTANMFEAAPSMAITCLFPHLREPYPRRRRAIPEARRLDTETTAALAIEVENGGTRDVILLSTGAREIRLDSLEAEGEFFWLQFRGTGLLRVLAANARALRSARTRIIDGFVPLYFTADVSRGGLSTENTYVRHLRDRESGTF